MTGKSVQLTGDKIHRVILEYVRSKWERTASPKRVQEIAQELGPDLRSRIDVLGIDSMQLLNVEFGSVMHKLHELEQQAATEDSGMLEKATRSADETEVRRLGQRPWTPRKRKRGLNRDL